MKTKQRQSVNVRWMIRRDMPEILEIENESFEFPWDEESFYRVLRQRIVIGMVAECDERIVGFMIYELHRTRIHLLNFAVSPWYRRTGIGSKMAEKVKAKLGIGRRDRINLETRESNLDSQLFWKSQGFRAIEVLKDFYDDSSEDAYLFSYKVRDEA